MTGKKELPRPLQVSKTSSPTPSLADLSQIMLRINEKSQRIFQEFVKRQQSPSVTLGQMVHLSNLYRDFFSKLMANPTKLAQVQYTYWQDYMDFWRSTILHWMGNQNTEQKSLEPPDKRFQDTAWNTHPFFSFVKRFYLMTAKHIQSVVNSVDGLDEKTSKKVDFYTRQFIDAMSPTNFLMTNPEVLRATVRSGGKNLLKGLDNLLNDLERSEQHLQIKRTDLKAFSIGKNIAVTPGKIIYQNQLMQLIQYEPQTKQVYRRPLLVIPPWINKYYIMDLSPQNSFVKWIVSQGFTVFVVSWVNPDHRHARIDFHHYMFEGVIEALNVIKKATGEDKVNAVGFCIGGTLLACTLAYLAAKRQSRIASATYLATLLDFSDPGDMGAFIDDNQIRLLEHEMHKKGYLDGGSMSLTFNLLRSNDLIWSYFIKNYLLGEEPFPFDMLYWNADPTNMPAHMHSFYLRGMYLNNLLTKPNGIQIDGVDINLKKIKIPVYFLSPQHDHIAPWKSTYEGIFLHSGPVEFVLSGSGHIAGIINHPDKKKYGYFTNTSIPRDPEVWLSNAEQHEGSWWPHWVHWLGSYSGEKMPARKPGGKNLPILEDAPGSYVHRRLLNRLEVGEKEVE